MHITRPPDVRCHSGCYIVTPYAYKSSLRSQYYEVVGTSIIHSAGTC
jgi:hypothetical protein